MQFRIENQPVFTTLTIDLTQGESFKAEAGAMVSMTNTIEMKATGAGKGLFGSLKAAVGGESVFASLYTAERGPGELVLAPTLPGDIIRFDLQGTILAQAGAYLAGSPELELSTQGSFKAMFAGEGLFLSKISGNGIVFLNSYGAIYEKELAPGEQYIVDTGHIVAFQETVTYKLRKAAKGIFSSLASGEGLVCEYTGPGKIWIQTRNLSALGAVLARFVSKS
ncbi:MAG TPA: TIGR00266 family protein [Acidobacteriota bacterium]|nr:TIGR00266 family protein [Acidobacteriota bacterium]